MGASMPENIMTNDDLSTMVDTDDEWIFSRTGIHSRHIAPKGYTNAGQTEAACRQALERAGVTAEDIDLLVVATITPDNFTPSVSATVHDNLGMRSDVLAFDVNAACSGFLVATRVALGQLNIMKPGSKALVVGSELMSRLLDFSDRSTCVLFGDGAGAAVVTLSDEDCWLCGGTCGSHDVLVSRAWYEGETPGVHMDGRAVFRFATESITRSINNLLEQSGMTLDNVDHVVCHQANARIIKHVIKSLKADPEKFFMNVEHMGNTSAASIPLALEEMSTRGILKPGDKVLLAGFGAGLTEGGMLFTW